MLVEVAALYREAILAEAMVTPILLCPPSHRNLKPLTLAHACIFCIPEVSIGIEQPYPGYNAACVSITSTPDHVLSHSSSNRATTLLQAKLKSCSWRRSILSWGRTSWKTDIVYET